MNYGNGFFYLAEIGDFRLAQNGCFHLALTLFQVINFPQKSRIQKKLLQITFARAFCFLWDNSLFQRNAPHFFD